ncbi:MAG TPA: hypothetical protein VF768_05435, partial [Holophagaceae bacterium]
SPGVVPDGLRPFEGLARVATVARSLVLRWANAEALPPAGPRPPAPAPGPGPHRPAGEGAK